MLIGILAIVVLVIATVVSWLMGLLTAMLFGVVTLLFLYALHKLELVEIDLDEHPFPSLLLVFSPFIMFFVGLALDKGGVLQVQPLSLTSLYAPFTLSLEVIMLIIVVVLLIVDIAVSQR